LRTIGRSVVRRLTVENASKSHERPELTPAAA